MDESKMGEDKSSERRDIMKLSKMLKILYGLLTVLVILMGMVVFLPSRGLAEEQDELLVIFRPGVSIQTIESINEEIGTEIIDFNEDLNLYKLRIVSDISVFEAVKKYKELPEVKYARPNYKAHFK